MSHAASRWPQGLVVALCAVAVALASFVAVVVVGLGKCGGDGGTPYAAAVAPALGAGTLLLLFVPVLALDQSCSSADQRTYDEWVETGRGGEQPADCAKY